MLPESGPCRLAVRGANRQNRPAIPPPDVSPEVILWQDERAKLDDPDVSDAEIIRAMVKYPRLIERPIVVAGTKAALGRPPENVLGIL